MEVIVSLSLAGTVLLGLIGIFASAYSVSRTADSGTTAGILAAATMADLKDEPFDQLAASAGAGETELPALTTNHVEYRAFLAVERLDPDPLSPDHQVLRLLLRLEWQDRGVESNSTAQTHRTRQLVLEGQVASGAAY